MTRRTPSAEHAKPARDTGVSVWGACDQAHESHGEKSIGADGKRFLFSPDEEKNRREKEPKREEK